MLPTRWKQFQASCSGNKCLSNKTVSLPLPPTQILEVAHVSQATPGNGINSFLSDQPGLIHFQADTVWQTWEFLPPKRSLSPFCRAGGFPDFSQTPGSGSGCVTWVSSAWSQESAPACHLRGREGQHPPGSSCFSLQAPLQFFLGFLSFFFASTDASIYQLSG